MKITMGKLSAIVALTLCVALPGQLFAKTFKVTSTDDPEFVDSANCTVPNRDCSLREALAAADETGKHDRVVFNVDGPIYLTRMLTVDQPVTINGGGDTIVRVHQGYEVTTLPDRQDDLSRPGLCGGLVCPNLPVLQPTYYSERGRNRQMLELHGDGSAIRGLVLDGSITPKPADLGVERIDFESDDLTDFFLFTIHNDGNAGDDSGDRWLVAGGVRCVLPLGSAEIIGNTFRNFNDNAIQIEGTFAIPVENSVPVIAPVVTDNVISGGAAGQPFASADGISLIVVLTAVVSNNTVTGFRNGLDVLVASGVNVSRNEFVENGTGIRFEGVSSEFGANVIEDNSITENATFGIEVVEVLGVQINNNDVNENAAFGIRVAEVFGARINNNDVNENGSDPDVQGGILVVDAGQIEIDLNTVEKNSGVGIAIDGGGGNTVGYNKVNKNGGAGIVLLNATQGNHVEYNEANKNSVGMVAGTVFGNNPSFPSWNFFDWNTFEKNTVFDVVDDDPDCNDFWTANSFGTVSSQGNCF